MGVHSEPPSVFRKVVAFNGPKVISQEPKARVDARPCKDIMRVSNVWLYSKTTLPYLFFGLLIIWHLISEKIFCMSLLVAIAKYKVTLIAKKTCFSKESTHIHMSILIF